MATSIDIQTAVKRKALADSIQTLFETYRRFCVLRDDALFLSFLPKGYQMTTLSSVAEEHRETAILAKMHLGMLITLYDDLADNPEHYNARLLTQLYQLPFSQDHVRESEIFPEERGLFELAGFLGEGLLEHARTLPLYSLLKDFLQFDLQQFYQTNTYSQLLTRLPVAANSLELAQHGPHNMGMIAAGMLDLMASPSLDLRELGSLRHILAIGQRVGRLCNLIATLDREMEEGDTTNEIIIKAIEGSGTSFQTISRERIESLIPTFENELDDHLLQIRKMQTKVKSVDIEKYLNGLRSLFHLHLKMIGQI